MVTLEQDYRTIGDTDLPSFLQELDGSPLQTHSVGLYKAAAGYTRLFLAHAYAENKYDTVGILIKPDMHNVLALRPRGYPEEAGTRNGFAIFASYADCVRAWLRRLTDNSIDTGKVPRNYVAARSFLDYCKVYNPVGDVHPVTGLANKSDRYAGELLAIINKLPAIEAGKSGADTVVNIGNRKLKIAIGVGHANTSGGNAYERAKNALVVNAVIKLAKISDGFEVRSYTPDDGLGWFNGPLDAAIRQVVNWYAEWPADVIHEVHHQGLGNTSIRGGFVIYPDGRGLSSPYPNPGDIDMDTKAHAGEITRLVSVEAIDVPKWGDGAMSERQTGVGGQGYRLGVFGATATPQIVAKATRILTEAATFTNPQDRAIMDRPDFAARQAEGTLKAYADLAAKRLGWTYKYRIGAAKQVKPATPKPTPTMPYPLGMDKETAQNLFGRVVVDGVPYEYYETGMVSSLWREEGMKTGKWPKLLDVQKVDTNADSADEGRLFIFDGGGLVVKPDDANTVVWVRSPVAN